MGFDADDLCSHHAEPSSALRGSQNPAEISYADARERKRCHSFDPPYRLNYALLVQLLELLETETEPLTIDLRVVLAQPGRRRADLPRRGGQLKRSTGVGQRAGRRMVNLHEELAFTILLRREHFLQIPYREDRNVQLLASPGKLVAVLLTDPRGHTGLEGVHVLEALHQGGKDLTLGPLWTTHQLFEALPVLVGQGQKCQVAIATREY